MKSKRFELIYRVFVRQHENVDLRMEEIKQKIQERYPKGFRFEEPDDVAWPIRTEDIEKMKRKGYLVGEISGNSCVYVRELKMIIDLENYKKDIIDIAIKEQFGKEFVIVRYVEEDVNDFQAL